MGSGTKDRRRHNVQSLGGVDLELGTQGFKDGVKYLRTERRTRIAGKFLGPDRAACVIAPLLPAAREPEFAHYPYLEVCRYLEVCGSRKRDRHHNRAGSVAKTAGRHCSD
jgi:hypothetical protein